MPVSPPRTTYTGPPYDMSPPGPNATPEELTAYKTYLSYWSQYGYYPPETQAQPATYPLSDNGSINIPSPYSGLPANMLPVGQPATNYPGMYMNPPGQSTRIARFDSSGNEIPESDTTTPVSYTKPIVGGYQLPGQMPWFSLAGKEGLPEYYRVQGPPTPGQQAALDIATQEIEAGTREQYSSLPPPVPGQQVAPAPAATSSGYGGGYYGGGYGRGGGGHGGGYSSGRPKQQQVYTRPTSPNVAQWYQALVNWRI